MTAIIDYDAGNIRSVEKALLALGEEAAVTDDPEKIAGADRVILPGVGAFGDAMRKIRERELAEVIRAAAEEKPFLGICLGLQLLFEESEESPDTEGLGILKGRIRRFQEGEGRKVPHMGWNSLAVRPGSRLFGGIPDGSYVYFVHSYYLTACDSGIVAARSDYGGEFDAAVERGNLFACQFHPEKSGGVGLAILRNFIAAEGGASGKDPAPEGLRTD